jgi:hypothetical protein
VRRWEGEGEGERGREREGEGVGNGGDVGKWGEMTQTLYAHINKIK